MCKVNGGTTVITLELKMNTALVEYYASILLSQNGVKLEHFTTEDIAAAAERALQTRFGDMAEDSDLFLARFANDETFMIELGV